MTTEMTTQTGFNALSPQQRQEHRAKIGVRVKAILGQFWHDAGTEPAIQALELEGWMDVLQNCAHGEIRAAWAQYQIGGPRSQAGRLSKPDAGALYKLITATRPKPRLVSPDVEPEKKIITAERAAEISREHGFPCVKVKKFGPL